MSEGGTGESWEKSSPASEMVRGESSESAKGLVCWETRGDARKHLEGREGEAVEAGRGYSPHSSVGPREKICWKE